MPKIFLSHASSDGDFAELVEHELKERGIDTWRDAAALRAGDDWTHEVDRAIQSANALVLILTPAAFASAYVTYEWAYAIGRELRVIPIIREESETHPRLAGVQNLDFTNRRARPWDDLASTIRDEAAQIAGPDSADQYETAREDVLEYLAGRGYRMVSFERIRRRISEDYDDEFLDELIQRYERDFRRATLKEGKRGLARRV